MDSKCQKLWLIWFFFLFRTHVKATRHQEHIIAENVGFLKNNLQNQHWFWKWFPFFIIPGGRCVMKMDHHCKFSMFYLKIRNLIWLILLLSETLGPWINNCVGHYNHGHFVGFLTFAVLGCAQASFVLAMTLYYGLNRVSDKWSHFDHFSIDVLIPIFVSVLVPFLWHWRGAQSDLNFNNTFGCDVCSWVGNRSSHSSRSFIILSSKLYRTWKNFNFVKSICSKMPKRLSHQLPKFFLYQRKKTSCWF